MRSAQNQSTRAVKTTINSAAARLLQRLLADTR
jgi:hypothetical protein